MCTVSVSGSCTITKPTFEAFCGANSTGCARYDEVVWGVGAWAGHGADAGDQRGHGWLQQAVPRLQPRVSGTRCTAWTVQVNTQYTGLEADYEHTIEVLKMDVSSMVFNTFIWCQVGGRMGSGRAGGPVASSWRWCLVLGTCAAAESGGGGGGGAQPNVALPRPLPSPPSGAHRCSTC